MATTHNGASKENSLSDQNSFADNQLSEENYTGNLISKYYSVDDKLPRQKDIVFYKANSNYVNPDIPYEEKIKHNKNKVIRHLLNEDITVGYTSMTETFLNNLIEDDVFLVKEVLMHVYKEVFSKKELLQSFIEVMSNLNYESLYPTNTAIVVGLVNHKCVGVQEAAIASFEKWDDKKNIEMLKNITYSTEWIEDYAEEVIEYLESC